MILGGYGLSGGAAIQFVDFTAYLFKGQWVCKCSLGSKYEFENMDYIQFWFKFSVEFLQSFATSFR